MIDLGRFCTDLEEIGLVEARPKRNTLLVPSY
jgi:hypothetical protein